MRISDWSSDVCSSDLQLARSRLGIQSLHVPLFGDLQRRVDEHLQEFALVEHATRHPPLRPERGDEADKDDKTCIHHQLGNLGNAANVLDAVLVREPQILVEAEIGRASCRERVCQYVEISVVGVSLKKTKKT